VSQTRVGESPVELEVVNPGDSENGIDAVDGQQFDQIPTDAARHGGAFLLNVRSKTALGWHGVPGKISEPVTDVQTGAAGVQAEGSVG
jgi:hypothetical protein